MTTTNSGAGVGMLATECRWFRGDVPCAPHKREGVHCFNTRGDRCPHYQRCSANVLIIKLGAAGDVIRTTPLVRRLRAAVPEARIWWLTLSPELLTPVADVVLPYTPQSLAVLQATPFDVLYNLDKDREACALAALLTAREKHGFTLAAGMPAPLDAAAHHKFLTGVFDDVSRNNTKHYVEEIFEICGFTFHGERYILDPFRDRGYTWKIPRRKPVVGLNTGCGGRWITRLWPDRSWVALARKLKRSGMTPLLLGGPQEEKKNKAIARASGALYLGHFPIPQFINEVDQCQVVVTAVTMAMHIAIGLEKKLVLFNNVFNPHEFELYGLGTILAPEGGCTCFYAATCSDPRYDSAGCMKNLKPETVFQAVKNLLRA
jgi:ADP-heptose:LPS heptosyltransferase